MKFKATLFFSLLSIVLIPPTISKLVERDEAEGLDYPERSTAGLFTLDNNFICSGVFITKRHIITAEDCFNVQRDILFKVLYTSTTCCDGFGRFYQLHREFYIDVDFYRNTLAVIRLPEELDVIPISLISEDELKEAISRQEVATCVGLAGLYEVIKRTAVLLPEKNCVEIYSNLVHPDGRNYFDTNLNFCFQLNDCFLRTFYGGPLFIHGKLAGIKVSNPLYMKITNLKEISDIISNEERHPLFEIDATFQSNLLVSLDSLNYQRWVIKYIDEPLLEFNLRTLNNQIIDFTYKFPYFDKTNYLITSQNIIYIINNFIYNPNINSVIIETDHVRYYYLIYTCKIFLGADIPTNVDHIMFAGTANAIGFKFNTSS